MTTTNELIYWIVREGNTNRLYATDTFATSGMSKIIWEPVLGGWFRSTDARRNEGNIGDALTTAYGRQFRLGTDAEFEARRNAGRVQAAARQVAARDGGLATPRQLDYLESLGVDITPAVRATLGKNVASEVIDAVKSGESIGRWNLFFQDGSN